MQWLGAIGILLEEGLELASAKHSFPHPPNLRTLNHTRRDNKVKGIEADDIRNCKLNLIEKSMINNPDFVWVRGAGDHDSAEAQAQCFEEREI